MSKENRKNAVSVIEASLRREIVHEGHPGALRNLSNYILNQLLKAGYLNESVRVHVSEVTQEMGDAAFACKTELDLLRESP